MYVDRSWIRPIRRRLRLILAVAVVISIGLWFNWHSKLTPVPIQPAFTDINDARKGVKNPLYADMSIFQPLKGDPCTTYIEKLASLYTESDILDLEAIHSHEYDISLYRRSRWEKEQRRAMHHEAREADRDQGWSPEQDEILRQRYLDESSKLVDHERLIINLVNHMRVFNKCVLDKSTGSAFESKIEKKVYPWMNNVLPVFKRWDGKTLGQGEVPKFDARKISDDIGTITQRLLKRSNGRGIVIPILPTQFRQQQIEEIQGLIRVLRAQKNTLPIQVVYRHSDLKASEMEKLKISARTEIRRFPYSYEWFQKTDTDSDIILRFKSSRDYPKQDLWFVDISNILNYKQHPQIRKSPLFSTHTFAITLASIFNSFEEAIVLLSSTIILQQNIPFFFRDPEYIKYGLRFFKTRSDYDSKERKSPIGFNEISNLIHGYLMPSQEDAETFGLFKRSLSSASSRIFDHNFRLMQDPTMMIFNKQKVLSGLLLSANLQLYPLLQGRFPLPKEEINPEYFWLGQEIAGTNTKINFNEPFAVAAGIPTPLQNRDFKLVTTSKELCSSSWGQLDPQDPSQLLYITSHQLENYYLPRGSFRRSIDDKFTTKNSIAKEMDDGQILTVEENEKELAEKLQRNPLYVEEILVPLDLLSPVIEEDYREPRQSWYKQVDFSHEADHPYWCAYDVVGSPHRPNRGTVIAASEKLQARYNFIAEVNMYKLEDNDD